MYIQVDFFGVPRQQVGQPSVDVQIARDTVTLGEVLREVGRRYHDFAVACLTDGGLRPEYIVNLGGDRFVRDSETKVQAGDTLLIMSADAGG